MNKIMKNNLKKLEL